MSVMLFGAFMNQHHHAPFLVTIHRSSTSGIRTAEMKWSNHARLSAYDVYMIGWPPSIPQQNPSLMTAGQNKLLLEALADGSMRFERIDVTRVPQTVSDDGKGGGEGVVSSQENTDISWAYEDKPGGPSTPVSRWIPFILTLINCAELHTTLLTKLNWPESTFRSYHSTTSNMARRPSRTFPLSSTPTHISRSNIPNST